VAKQIQNALQWMDGGYARLSAWALDHVKWVIAGAVGLLVGSFALVVLLGIEFLPETDDAFFIVNFETRMGTTYNTTRGLANDLEKLIREEVGAELKSISSTVGDGGSHLGALSVILVPKDERKENIWAITNRLDRKIRQTVLDLRFGIVLQGMASLATQATGVSSPIVIRLAGDDIEAMFSYAQKIKAIAEKTPGTRSFKISHQVGKPEVQIRIKREEAVSLGLSPLEVAASVRTASGAMARAAAAATRDSISWAMAMLRERRRRRRAVRATRTTSGSRPRRAPNRHARMRRSRREWRNV
jgi:HAE1 family hydrophobic/amphiphilic exporter-1